MKYKINYTNIKLVISMILRFKLAWSIFYHMNNNLYVRHVIFTYTFIISEEITTVKSLLIGQWFEAILYPLSLNLEIMSVTEQVGPGLSEVVRNVTKVAIPLYRPDQLPWYLNGTILPNITLDEEAVALWHYQLPLQPLDRLHNQLMFLPRGVSVLFLRLSCS